MKTCSVPLQMVWFDLYIEADTVSFLRNIKVSGYLLRQVEKQCWWQFEVTANKKKSLTFSSSGLVSFGLTWMQAFKINLTSSFQVNSTGFVWKLWFTSHLWGFFSRTEGRSTLWRCFEDDLDRWEPSQRYSTLIEASARALTLSGCRLVEVTREKWRWTRPDGRSRSPLRQPCLASARCDALDHLDWEARSSVPLVHPSRSAEATLEQGGKPQTRAPPTS